MKRLSILSAALLLAACEHPGAIDGYGFDVDLDFASQPVISGDDFPAPQVIVTGGSGDLLIEGRVRAPNSCQRLRATADGEARYVDVTVRIDPVDQACARILGNFAYTARAKRLDAGEYILRLRHEYPGTEWDPPVQEFQVTVR